MSPYAVIIPYNRQTPDRRELVWWECDVHGDEGVSRPMRPFWSMSEARSWAEDQGLEIQDQ